MPTVFLSPIFNAVGQPTEGWLPLDGGKIYTYLAGTDTPQATWTTADGDVENSNPIILGVDGRPPHEIWIESGVAMLFELKDADDNEIQDYDNITGINDVTASASEVAIQEEGVAQGNAHTLNFVGGSVTAGVSGSVATITVTSASGTLTSGDIVASAARTRSGALLCDGSAVSRSTYSTLFGVIVPSLGTFTVTIATPAVFSLTNHGLVAGDQVYFTTTGALPTGLSANTIYFVISAGLTSSAFEVSATRGGSAINTTGSQSGVHTLRFCPYGLGNGTTTFNVPDLSGRTMISSGTGSGLTARPLGLKDGAETVTLTGAQSGTSVHSHTGTSDGDAVAEIPVAYNQESGTSSIAQISAPPIDTFDVPISVGNITINNSSAASASESHNNMPPFNVVNFFIITG